ncbi:hypothetical protein NDU88_002994 [Pleurodeles waltl]|uniref:Uncharacterized protein n=1 Tax=Pleurodeles waltl TaxID=8319 RepID=A0AAV7RH73_PLEWA|nr:hypothetical protein NDU88_002994 [Pleurodeles waltl]
MLMCLRDGLVLTISAVGSGCPNEAGILGQPWQIAVPRGAEPDPPQRGPATRKRPSGYGGHAAWVRSEKPWKESRRRRRCSAGQVSPGNLDAVRASGWA